MKRLLALILISALFLQGCGSLKLEGIDLKKLEKIGIISVVSDKQQKKYTEKEEKFITDKGQINKFARLVASGNIDNGIRLDRLPGEYRLKLYFEDGKVINASYWIQLERYNLNIEGIPGEITVDSKAMDEIITTAAEEVGRERNEDPYME
jgi:PBP1b-binding outer membrane lipoprotein LpoB